MASYNWSLPMPRRGNRQAPVIAQVQSVAPAFWCRTTVLAAVSALLYRSDGRMLYLLLIACGFALIGDLVTILVNVPINNRLATWNPSALPADYQDYLRRWWQWHHVRLVGMFTAMCLVFGAMLVRKYD